jgi:putative peptidoglycan lipid II flippase
MPVVTDPYPGGSTAAASAPTAVSGPETGVLPVADPLVTPEDGGPRRGRRTAVVAAVAAAVVLAVVAAVVVIGMRGHPKSEKSIARPAATPTPVHVVSVEPYAGNGGSADHPEEASLATDGQASTAWYTQHYASAAFGNLRSGAGLLFDLGRPVAVRTLKLKLAVSGVALQVHAANSVGALMSSTAVQRSSNASGTVVVQPTATARYWLVWFTKLASDDGAFRAGVSEASFAR